MNKRKNKNKNKKIWLLILIVGIIFIFSIITFIVIKNNVKFELIGNNSYTIEVNEDYIDEGYILTLFNKPITNSNVSKKNNLNVKKIGTYYVNYYLNFYGIKYKLKRKINVVDKTKPDISLNGDSTLSLYTGDSYEEKGAKAIDNYDGDITDNIVIDGNVDTNKVGDYLLTYTIKDSSGNVNSITRTVKVEKKISYTVNYNDPIAKFVKNNGYNVSIGYYNLVSGKSYYYKEKKIYYGASLIKTLDALYLYDNNLVNDDLKPYINKAISISDNPSHQYLVNYIGKQNLRNYGVSLGASNTLLGGDNYGNTTVLDQIAYYKKLYSIIQNNEEFKSFFINDYYNYIKIDGLSCMHKYGYWSIYFHDVGIIFDKEPYIIVVLTEDGVNNAKEITAISNLINKYHNNKQL